MAGALILTEWSLGARFLSRALLPSLSTESASELSPNKTDKDPEKCQPFLTAKTWLSSCSPEAAQRRVAGMYLRPSEPWASRRRFLSVEPRNAPLCGAGTHWGISVRTCEKGHVWPLAGLPDEKGHVWPLVGLPDDSTLSSLHPVSGRASRVMRHLTFHASSGGWDARRPGWGPYG